MKKITLALVFVALAILVIFSLSPQTVQSGDEPPIPEVVEPSLKEKLMSADAPTRLTLITAYVETKAKEYNVSASQMLTTIRCENKPLDPNQQSGHRYDFNSPKRGIVKGDQERSFGLAMIHLPDHPSVSHAQATDPEYAIDFMAKHFAKGEQTMWTCWRIHYQ